MVIRPFRETDRDAIKDITIASFNEHSSIDRNIERLFGESGGKDWAWRKRRSLDEDMDAQPDGILVAEEDGAVIGYITMRLDRDTLIGWIPNLAVSPSAQKGGIGRQLIDAALEHMRAAGMTLAKIETLDSNEVGKRFYPSMGFEIVAKQVHFAMRL